MADINADLVDALEYTHEFTEAQMRVLRNPSLTGPLLLRGAGRIPSRAYWRMVGIDYGTEATPEMLKPIKAKGHWVDEDGNEVVL